MDTTVEHENGCRYCRTGKLVFARHLHKQGNELWKCSKCGQYTMFRAPRGPVQVLPSKTEGDIPSEGNHE